MKYEVYSEKGGTNFDADEVYVKEKIAICKKGDDIVAVVPMENVFWIVKSE